MTTTSSTRPLVTSSMTTSDILTTVKELTTISSESPKTSTPVPDMTSVITTLSTVSDVLTTEATQSTTALTDQPKSTVSLTSADIVTTLMTMTTSPATSCFGCRSGEGSLVLPGQIYENGCERKLCGSDCKFVDESLTAKECLVTRLEQIYTFDNQLRFMQSLDYQGLY